MSGSNAFFFIANALWLDFVNTEIAVEGLPEDLLRAEADLYAWLSQAGISPQRETPDASLLLAARELRSFLRTLAGEMSEGTVLEETVTRLDALLGRHRGGMRLARGAQGWDLRFTPDAAMEEAALFPVIHSAAEMLSAGDWQRIRRCEGAKCILFFYDTSKNHKRRWCSMDGCGNRHKAAAHYRRHVGASSEMGLGKRSADGSHAEEGGNAAGLPA